MSSNRTPDDDAIDLRTPAPGCHAARREGPWAAAPTAALLDRAERVLEDLEFSAALAWAHLAWVDAAVAVVSRRCGADLDALDDEGLATWDRTRTLAGRAEVHRAALRTLEDDDTFARRCAAALVALDGIEVGFDDGAAEVHVPDFAAGDVGFLRWRGAATQGVRSPVPRPDYERLVDAVWGSAHGHRVLGVLDWVGLAEAGVSGRWVPELVAGVLGRYGVFVRTGAPRDAAVVLPAVVARFVAVASLARHPVVTSPVTDDPLEALDAVGEFLDRVGDPAWRSARTRDRDRLAETHRGSGVLHATLA